MPWQKKFDVDEVLDKAMQAFWTRGYEATSLHDLVACTGIHRGSLYATYGDKRSLFISALRRYDDVVRHRLTAEFAEQYGPREAIRQLFLAFVSEVSKPGSNRGCFLTNTALELSAHDEEIGSIVAHAQEETEAFFLRMIEKGQQLGEISAPIAPVDTARGLLATLLGLVVLTRSRPDRSLLEAIINDALDRLE